MKRFLIPLAPILVGGALFISAPAAANGDHDCDSYQGSTWPHEDECEPDDICERKPWKPECQETTTTTVPDTTSTTTTVTPSTSTTVAPTTTVIETTYTSSPATTTTLAVCVDCVPNTQVVTTPPTTAPPSTPAPTTTTIPKQCKDANGVVTTDPARCAVLPGTGPREDFIGGLAMISLGLIALGLLLFAWVARKPTS
jgi:hypothetical protein